MTRSTRAAATLVAALTLTSLVAVAHPAAAQDAAATYREIEQTLGSVPAMFKVLPEAGVAGAWAEFKNIELNPDTKLDGKTKELIGLAVASQIPCHYCVYGHTVFAKLNGATDEEVREAVAMAAITRHWSTLLNGTQVSLEEHKADIDAAARHAQANARKTAGTNQ
ncbi:carboxymuconolactone decarboxylase family protein [Mesorhizobium sp.]|uniref:carboxymuconolactone decarboxylase family protein n=1 Tax=Mesorhizobium sp. TaxID=1871066 RepID=UPI000FE82157|nr:carboxymuconolactone decarboxylase family protein [Mesorhizobium sp.]RWI72225.1 MAG: carboxymuconolactone decarboxylase family protein [Mesorhizobium sp.]